MMMPPLNELSLSQDRIFDIAIKLDELARTLGVDSDLAAEKLEALLDKQIAFQRLRSGRPVRR